MAAILFCAGLSISGPSAAAGPFDDLKDFLNAPIQGLGGLFGGNGNVAPTLPAPAPQSGASSGGGGTIGGGGTTTATAGGSSAQQDGEASRIFAGPQEYPPVEFGAYAIVAFRSAASSFEIERFHTICEAYRLAIPDAADLDIPLSQQLVTVWPISSADASARISAADETEKCDIASENYGTIIGLRAIRHAKVVSSELADDFASRPGPFLLAWAPASKKGDEDALILRMDLSDVDTPAAAKLRFEFWVQQIEGNPDLWLNGWQSVSILRRVGETADRYGQIILDFLKG